MGKSRNGIPDGWLHCPPYSKTVIAGRFVAFKTPIDKNNISKSARDLVWLPSEIHKAFPTLGLWINLSFRTRFDTDLVGTPNCRYEHIPCKGKSVPSRDQINHFFDIVDKFQADPASNGRLIGVHCTHGHNRTGFLIVTYMVERLNYSIFDALQEFSDARPPGIYRDYLLKHLERAYAGKYRLKIPKTPDWSLNESRPLPENSVLIEGIPEKSDENRIKIFHKLCRVVEFDCRSEEIQQIRRLGVDKELTPPILIEFRSISIRDAFFRYFVRNRDNLNSREGRDVLGSARGREPIFIHDYTRATDYNLYKRAQTMVQQRPTNYRSVRLKHGRVYLVKHTNEMKQIDSLHKLKHLLK